MNFPQLIKMPKKTIKHSARIDFQLKVEGQEIPARLYREFRTNVRASIGKTAAILRLPVHLSKAEQDRQVKWFTSWVAQRVSQSKALSDHFEHRTYRDGDILQVGERRYALKLQWEDRKTHTGKLLPEGRILLKLSREDNGHSLSKNIQHLLSRIVAQDFLPAITRRVQELNQQHFQQPVNGVYLKYNHSNWGSCSSVGNINLSTRLLFAPQEVIDYVIIHELAHRLEMNHSPRFWKLVSDAMPDYKDKEEWLKVNGSKLTF